MPRTVDRSYDPTVVVAHPDDELLYFAPVIAKSTVVLVTDGKGSGPADRIDTFRRVCASMRSGPVHLLNLPDRWDGFTGNELVALRILLRPFALKATGLFTHGLGGEYGHAQHKQIAQALKDITPTGTPLLAPCFDGPVEDSVRVHLAPDDYRAAKRFLVDDYKVDFGIFPYMPIQHFHSLRRAGS